VEIHLDTQGRKRWFGLWLGPFIPTSGTGQKLCEHWVAQIILPCWLGVLRDEPWSGWGLLVGCSENAAIVNQEKRSVVSPKWSQRAVRGRPGFQEDAGWWTTRRADADCCEIKFKVLWVWGHGGVVEAVSKRTGSQGKPFSGSCTLVVELGSRADGHSDGVSLAKVFINHLDRPDFWSRLGGIGLACRSPGSNRSRLT